MHVIILFEQQNYVHNNIYCSSALSNSYKVRDLEGRGGFNKGGEGVNGCFTMYMMDRL